MIDDKTENRTRSYFPPDIAAVVAPILMCIGGVYVASGLSWARGLGDTSLLDLALLVGGAGSILLFFARLPLYRQRRFFSLGPRSLTGIHRRLYYAAYWLIVPSVALLALLLFKLK